MLYLTILNETKNMVLQSRNLLKSQQYFLKHRNEPRVDQAVGRGQIRKITLSWT